MWNIAGMNRASREKLCENLLMTGPRRGEALGLRRGNIPGSGETAVVWAADELMDSASVIHG